MAMFPLFRATDIGNGEQIASTKDKQPNLPLDDELSPDEDEPYFLDLAGDPRVSRDELVLRFLESRGSRASRPRRSAQDPVPVDGSQATEAVAPSQTRSGPTHGSEKRGARAAPIAKPAVANKLREPVCGAECFLNRLTTQGPGCTSEDQARALSGRHCDRTIHRQQEIKANRGAQT
jgi:hypothetical protein